MNESEILGYSFAACYCAGVAVTWFVDKAIKRYKRNEIIKRQWQNLQPRTTVQLHQTHD
jgi:hypothetical protein